MAKAARKAQTSSADDKKLHAVMAIIGAVVVALMLTVFVIEAARGEGGAPDISLEIIDTKRSGDDWIAKIRATNSGRATATQVLVEGELGNGETGELTFDYLPDGSSRTGGLVFTSDPDAGGLTLRVLGYSDP